MNYPKDAARASRTWLALFFLVVGACNVQAGPPLLPDLVVTEMFASAPLDGEVSFNVKVENAGELAANLDGTDPGPEDNVMFNGYLSADTSLESGTDTLIISVPLSGMLNPDESIRSEMMTTFVQDGSLPYFIVSVDSNDDVEEAEEDNNVRSTPLNAPDLIVTELEILLVTSTNYTARYTIENIGTGPADLNGADDIDVFDNIGYQNFFSEDEILSSPGDVGAGGAFLFDPLPVLQPGETLSRQISAGRANQGERPFLIMLMDNSNKMEEANEDNNMAIAIVEDPPPDGVWVLK